MKSWGCGLRALRAARYFSQCRIRKGENVPSIGPKPSIDIRYIRQNPEIFSQNCLERNYQAQSEHPFKIVKLFDQWRQSQKEARSLREKSNAIRTQLSHSRTFSGLEQGREDTPTKSRQELIEEARKLKDELATTETYEAQLTLEIEALAAELPNLTSPDTPRQEPATVTSYINEGLKPEGIRDHVRVGVELDVLDFTSTAAASGWGWYHLENEAAFLEQALVQYALSVATKHGFTFVAPQSMVYSHIGSACGYRPRDQSGEQQVYDIQQNERDAGRGQPAYCLAGTAEIPFAGMKVNEVIDRDDLPLRIVGSSRCFRQEAGARGAKTKGLYRVHEFTKVEMFAWTVAGEEKETFDLMLKVQTEILKGLGLYCRILEMPSTDLGASAYRKQDIEAYFPSRQNLNEGWGEVTSTSICIDYQTRRLNTRMKNPAGSDVTMEFPSTVNGTALAVPRIIAALLEYHCSEGPLPESSTTEQGPQLSVRIPEVLWPWMHGHHIIEKKVKPPKGKKG